MLGSYTNTTHSGFMISENAETAVKHDHMLRRTRTGKFCFPDKMSTFLDAAVFSASKIKPDDKTRLSLCETSGSNTLSDMSGT